MEATHSPWVPKGHALAHVEAAIVDGGPCQLCDALVRLPIITPCAHVLCLACAATARCACPLPGEASSEWQAAVAWERWVEMQEALVAPKSPLKHCQARSMPLCWM